MSTISSIVFAGSHTITQPFGCSSVVINGRHVEPWWNIADCWWHCGVDVGDMPLRTPLFAARAGKVVNVGWGQLGIAVTGTRQTDWYIHIDSAAPGIVVGVLVSRGQLVAYSGNKVPGGGYSSGPHLHFEVQTAAAPHYNLPATSLDPIPVLAATFTLGSGSLGDDLVTTQAEFDDLVAKNPQLGGAGYAARLIYAIGATYVPANPGATTSARLTEILAAIRAVPGGQAALDAIAALKAEQEANHASEVSALAALAADLKAVPAVAADPALAALAQDIDDRLKNLSLKVV